MQTATPLNQAFGILLDRGFTEAQALCALQRLKTSGKIEGSPDFGYYVRVCDLPRTSK